MKWFEMLEEFCKELWKKPIKKWVKIAIMIVAIAIVTWMSCACSTWYIHRSRAVSNCDTIEFINEYQSDVKKK